MRMPLLHYRAGPQALRILRQRGLTPGELSALLLPAIGPKWLVLVGLDRALLAHGFLHQGTRRLLLFGASIGSWRALALAARDPQRTHAALVDAYCSQRFTHADTPAVISAAYRRLIENVYSQDDLCHALQHPRMDIAIATARARGLFGHEHRLLQGTAISAAALLNVCSRHAQRLFFERVIFASTAGAGAPHPGLRDLEGTRAPLCADNVRDVALASGSVPLYMQRVSNLAHAPLGHYLDGGFSDYHINQRVKADEGINLLLLHQPRIVPSWLDKFAPWRRAPAQTLTHTLLVHPSAEFVRSLPGSAVPTRDDFTRFVAEPERRIARWHAVVTQSAELGARLIEDARSGAIASAVQPL
jgi:hypothetical protein